VVSRNWPVTTYSGAEVDLQEVLDAAYAAVARWRLEEILAELGRLTDVELGLTLDMENIDRDTKALWIWLDAFRGERADSDDVRKLAKSLGVDPDVLKNMGLLRKEKDLFVLLSPLEADLKKVSRHLAGQEAKSRLADNWEEREFPNFLGAAVWNAIALMGGAEPDHRGEGALARWLARSGVSANRDFRGAFAVTMILLEKAFGQDRAESPWKQVLIEARRAWDLVIRDGRWQRW
ncbi:MAG: hypothetical protein H5T99_14335, partial [Moorella sp. (in: Bacteria)]|nr:hypothetical protein [Moorella sp. (in: firmicutes)]